MAAIKKGTIKMIKLNKLNQAIQRGYNGGSDTIFSETIHKDILKSSLMLENKMKASGTVSSLTTTEHENKQSYKDVIDRMTNTIETAYKDNKEYLKAISELRFWDALRELVELDNQERPADKKRPLLDEKRPPNANVFIGTMLSAKLNKAGAVLPEWCHCSPVIHVDAIVIFFQDFSKNSNGGLNRGFY